MDKSLDPTIGRTPEPDSQDGDPAVSHTGGRAITPRDLLAQRHHVVQCAFLSAEAALLAVLARSAGAALVVYFIATVVRLVWSYRTRLPGWSLVISIVIDMALLMGIIWTFHIHYGQPPAFYLKAPTLQIGSTLLVGFSEVAYKQEFDG